VRWPLWTFGLVALGGIIPFLSFPLERYVARQVTELLVTLETPPETLAEKAAPAGE
jgi:hypothetical protein